MKVTFLGSAAAEGWPALFCVCEACREARRRGGPNLRRRTCYLINADTLVDFGPDIAWQCTEFGIDLADIRVLSLGTTTDLGARPRRLDRGGLLPWARHATSVFLRGQSLAAANATYHLLPKAQSVRIDPSVPDKLLRLDGVTPDQLRGFAEHHSRLRNGEVQAVFLDHEAAPYVPFHTPKDLPT